MCSPEQSSHFLSSTTYDSPANGTQAEKNRIHCEHILYELLLSDIKRKNKARKKNALPHETMPVINT
jgi:hypothetical protein